MRRCSKRGGTWRGCAPWRPTGRRRWPPSAATTWSSIRCSGGAQAQQGQAEERARAAEQRAKEADDLKATLDAKVAALTIAEDRLLQERTARQGAEGQLQQERAALVDARSALKRERAAREVAQKSLEERNAEFSKLEGELVVLSITSASQEQSLKEQSDTVVGLQQAIEAERRALEVERKQVEGKLLFCLLFY
jgi:uncharacterized coiled-coil protein SlyX